MFQKTELTTDRIITAAKIEALAERTSWTELTSEHVAYHHETLEIIGNELRSLIANWESEYYDHLETYMNTDLVQLIEELSYNPTNFGFMPTTKKEITAPATADRKSFRRKARAYAKKNGLSYTIQPDGSYLFSDGTTLSE